MAAKPNEKFEAAVKVIQSLPKNGTFQPSNELLLKFYGYYKQATLGPCNTPKPAFYDIVGKAKWDAWNKLGKMPAEEAMLNYVEELKNIVEAMPHTTMVAEFVEKLGTFYELVDEQGSPLKKSSKPDVSNGDVPRENGAGGHPEGDSASNESVSPRSVSEESSESVDVSAESSPEHTAVARLSPASIENTVVVLPLKAPPGKPKDDDQNDSPPPSPIHPPNQNGMPVVNGQHRRVDSEGLSDSDGEEFCDTSDLPDEQLRSVSQTSTPDVVAPYNHIVTTATVHQTIDGVSSYTSSIPELSVNHIQQPISDLVTCRGGGDSSSNSQVPDIGRTDNVSSPDRTSRGTLPSNTQPLQRATFLASGGSGGGDRDPSQGIPRSEVNEQIAIALVRLQQDMNSVLARLNTLEALSVAQHQMHRSRQNSESEGRSHRQQTVSSQWWWPFPRLDGRSVFFIMVWPLIIHWVLTVLARRRNRRR